MNKTLLFIGQGEAGFDGLPGKPGVPGKDVSCRPLQDILQTRQNFFLSDLTLR